MKTGYHWDDGSFKVVELENGVLLTKAGDSIALTSDEVTHLINVLKGREWLRNRPELTNATGDGNTDGATLE